jgi:hypothetical protein
MMADDGISAIIEQGHPDHLIGTEMNEYRGCTYRMS